MSEELNIMEEQMEDEIVTLVGSDGEEIDFVEIAGIALDSGFYVILQPVEPMEGMAEDEALVFAVEQGEDGEEHFNIEMDEDTIQAVFDRYYQLLEEAEAQEE